MSLLPKVHTRRRGESGWVVGSVSGRHVLVGGGVLMVIRTLEASECLPDAWAMYSERGGTLKHDQFIEIATQSMDLLCPSTATPKSMRYLWVRTVLWRSATTNRFASWLSWIFRTPILQMSIPLALLAPAILLFGGSLERVNSISPSWSDLSFGAALFLIGGAFHELGHAAALRRYGQEAGEIGFGFYLGVIPVFYTDLSRAWLLTRRQRVVVNLAGIHVQLLYGLVLTVICLYWPLPWLQIGSVGIVILAAFQLLPFARCDGYWVLCDALDEPSLARFNKATFTVAFKGTGRAKHSARWHLGYQTFNVVVISAVASTMALRTARLLHDLRLYANESILTETVRQPSSWFALLGTLVLTWQGIRFLHHFSKGFGLGRQPEQAILP